MLRALIELLRVDYDQWRALTRTALKLDLRTASLGQFHSRQPGKSQGFYRQWISRLLIYLFMGGILSPTVWIVKDVFLSGTVILTYTMVMTAMLVLIDFSAVVVSPDDFAILGYQPVTSRTYFITRLTNVLMYTTIVTMALGLVPMGMFFFARGFRPLLGCAAFCALLLSGAGIALFLVLIYAGILRLVHPNKLKRVLSYVQFLLSFVIYGGYIFLPRLVDARTMGRMTVDKSFWLMLHPATWFASYLDLASGRRGMAEIAPALLSLAVLGWLVHQARGKLALDYSDRLSAASALSEGRPKGPAPAVRAAILFKGREARAVALLVRNQFKHDAKFRMAVLGIIPMTILYLFMGLREGSMSDPFVSRGAGFGQSLLLYMAVLMFPTMLKASLTYSDSYPASWIYYATPADRGRLVLWSKNFIFVYFVLPYLVFIGAVFLYFFRNPWHVLLHLSVLALISHFFLQIAVFFNPALPFSLPARKGQRSSSFIVTIFFGPILAIGMLYIFSRWVYPNAILLFALLAGMAVASWLCERALRARVRRHTLSIEYHE
jgi:hypothetical protein